MKFRSLAIGLLGAVLASPVLADEPKHSMTGVYVEAHGGLDMAELSGFGPIGLSESAIGYGLSIGYDHQFGPFFLGIAGDHTWTDALVIERHWSVTGRAGITVGNAAPYVLAGYKRAEVPGLSLDGWVAGAGIEFAIWRGLALGGEYRFSTYDLPTGLAGLDGEQHEVRATLKYKFGGLF